MRIRMSIFVCIFLLDGGFSPWIFCAVEHSLVGINTMSRLGSDQIDAEESNQGRTFLSFSSCINFFVHPFTRRQDLDAWNRGSCCVGGIVSVNNIGTDVHL
jgi:hypothetical protein